MTNVLILRVPAAEGGDLIDIRDYILESLERGGFIRRQRDENSRRRGLVEITDAGQVALAAWRERCRQLEERMLTDFTPEEQAQFADFLSRAYRNLRGGEEESE